MRKYTLLVAILWAYRQYIITHLLVGDAQCLLRFKLEQKYSSFSVKLVNPKLIATEMKLFKMRHLVLVMVLLNINQSTDGFINHRIKAGNRQTAGLAFKTDKSTAGK